MNSTFLLKVLIKLIRPYTRIQIGFISGELNIEPSDVENLLVSCILDSTITGRIDQVGTGQRMFLYYNVSIMELC